jgi:hypothetical protein
MNIFHPPNHKGKTATDIIKLSIFESIGYFHRAVSWLDLFERSNSWPTLLYACIEGRYGIEYLLFEELVLGTGLTLSRQDYERCVKEPTSLKKLINKIIPNYKKLKQFTEAVAHFMPELPPIISWEPNDLMRSWGELSSLLHWCGNRLETVENEECKKEALKKAKAVLLPIWEKINSGRSACMTPENMKPKVHKIWLQFKEDKIDIESVEDQLKLLDPDYKIHVKKKP